MASSCPDCGSAMEFEVELSPVRTGSCAACGHTFTLVGGTRGVQRPAGTDTPEVSSPDTDEDDSDGVESDEAEAPPAGVACPSCGSALIFSADDQGHLGAACSGCEIHYALRPAGDESRPSRRPSFSDRDRRDAGPGAVGPRARPCRECGGVLRFSTAPDGGVSAECTSCGNRFSLPPRTDRGDGGGRPFRGGFNRGGGSRGGFRGGREDARPGGRFRRDDRAPRGGGFDADKRRRRRRSE
jgi:DNA-directed RNA polymerase subunit M/transcription elongation factor TFIIS